MNEFSKNCKNLLKYFFGQFKRAIFWSHSLSFETIPIYLSSLDRISFNKMYKKIP